MGPETRARDMSYSIEYSRAISRTDVGSFLGLVVWRSMKRGLLVHGVCFHYGLVSVVTSWEHEMSVVSVACQK